MALNVFLPHEIVSRAAKNVFDSGRHPIQWLRKGEKEERSNAYCYLIRPIPTGSANLKELLIRKRTDGRTAAGRPGAPAVGAEVG